MTLKWMITSIVFILCVLLIAQLYKGKESIAYLI